MVLSYQRRLLAAGCFMALAVVSFLLVVGLVVVGRGVNTPLFWALPASTVFLLLSILIQPSR